MYRKDTSDSRWTSPLPRVTLIHVLTRISRVSSAQWRSLPWLHRYLVTIRAPVLAMTLTAALTGLLLAAIDGTFDIQRGLLVIFGLLAAHATNNLVNDWIDWRQGIDTSDYFRGRYGTHVLAQGLVSERHHQRLTLTTAAFAVACGLALIPMAGTPVGWLMLAGAFFVLFYTWPLKHIALGEIAVLIVWGPLMTGGSYYVLTGHITLPVALLSLAWAIAPMLVIVGKHLDKCSEDRHLGVHSLPVLLGDLATRRLCLGLMAVQFAMFLAIVILWPRYVLLLLCLASFPAAARLWRAFQRPQPADRPSRWPPSLWPLWFSALTFVFAREIGLTLLLALAGTLIWLS